MENNDRTSQMVSQNESLQNNSETASPTQILETQPVSTISSENNIELKKWLIAGGLVACTLAICILLSKETDVCFLSACNDYANSAPTDSSASIGNDFLAYAGGAASLIALTAVGVSLLPAVAISTGVWFVVHLIR